MCLGGHASSRARLLPGREHLPLCAQTCTCLLPACTHHDSTRLPWAPCDALQRPGSGLSCSWTDGSRHRERTFHNSVKNCLKSRVVPVQHWCGPTLQGEKQPAHAHASDGCQDPLAHLCRHAWQHQAPQEQGGRRAGDCCMLRGAEALQGFSCLREGFLQRNFMTELAPGLAGGRQPP